MSLFEVHQCTNPVCGLRIPIDPEVNKGAYCPRCGASMMVITAYAENNDVLQRERTGRISVLLDNIRSALNVGAIIRTADGVGVEHLYLGGITPEPGDNPAVGKTALGAEKKIRWSHHHNAFYLARDLKKEGYCLLALECTPDAIPLSQFRLSRGDERPLLLIVGNEQAGVDPGLLDLCDDILSIPMLGVKTSLNAATAFGIAVYWLAFSSGRDYE